MWGACLVVTVSRGGLRWHTNRRLFADDYCAFFGMLSLTGLSAVITRQLPQFYVDAEYLKTSAGNPFTPTPVPIEEYLARNETSLKLMFSQMLLFWTTLWSAKFSLLFFFRRLIVGLPKYMRIWWAAFMIVLVLYIACMTANFVACMPLSKNWSPTGCSDTKDIAREDLVIRLSTVADVFTDTLIMLFPLNLLRNLRISVSQKLGLAAVFSLGTIIIAFAFVRMVQVTTPTSDHSESLDALIDSPFLLSMWSDIECGVSMIVATLPIFRFVLNSSAAQARGRKYYASEARLAREKSVRPKKRPRMGRSDSAILMESLSEREWELEFGSRTGLNTMDALRKQIDVEIMEIPRSPPP
ncbi:hypothetical protein K432DRAFT_340507, partial [Lepidopterella palustris CBS 459.81]